VKKAERITIRKCGSFVAVHNVIGYGGDFGGEVFGWAKRLEGFDSRHGISFLKGFGQIL
jgi:hypothetical protein